MKLTTYKIMINKGRYKIFHSDEYERMLELQPSVFPFFDFSIVGWDIFLVSPLYKLGIGCRVGMWE